MSIAIGGDSNDIEVLADINITPLIDVMLVLLIMLIITIPIQLHSVNLNLPVGTPPPPAVQAEVVRIDIDADGTMRWNGADVGGTAALNARLAEAAARATQPELHIRADKRTEYKWVVKAMASVQQHGLTKIGIVGNEQFM
jgi:biopolymer transport protein ExbD